MWNPGVIYIHALQGRPFYSNARLTLSAGRPFPRLRTGSDGVTFGLTPTELSKLLGSSQQAVVYSDALSSHGWTHTAEVSVCRSCLRNGLPCRTRRSDRYGQELSRLMAFNNHEEGIRGRLAL